MALIQVINTLPTDAAYNEGGWTLTLQWCRWHFDNSDTAFGYRFVWIDPEAKMHPTRGGTLIPSLDVAARLIAKARDYGWGDYDAKAMAKGPRSAVKAIEAKKQSKRGIILNLLTRPEGATRPELLAALGWKTISVQRWAAESNLSLRTENENGRLRYFASAKTTPDAVIEIEELAA